MAKTQDSIDVSVRLKRDAHEALVQIAKRAGMSVSDFIRAATAQKANQAGYDLDLSYPRLGHGLDKINAVKQKKKA